MKITKKQRKREKGMNAATKRDFEKGYTKPHLFSKGTTYVNPKIFNL